MLELRDTLSALGFSADFSASEIQQMVHAASDGEYNVRLWNMKDN